MNQDWEDGGNEDLGKEIRRHKSLQVECPLVLFLGQRNENLAFKYGNLKACAFLCIRIAIDLWLLCVLFFNIYFNGRLFTIL